MIVRIATFVQPANRVVHGPRGAARVSAPPRRKIRHLVLGPRRPPEFRLPSAFVCGGRPVSMPLTRRRVVMFLWSMLRGDSMKKFCIRSNPKPSRPAPGPRGRARALETLEDRTLLSFAGPANLPVGPAPIGIVSVDFNRDGVPDLVVANNGAPDGSLSSLSFLAGNGDG